MLILILCVIATIGGFYLFDKMAYKHDNIAGFSVVVGIVGAIALFFTATCALVEAVVKETAYQNKLYEKEVIEYRIDNIYEDVVGNEMLFNDIVEFNNSLRSAKKWANNPWTNIFWNDDVASIDYIELPQFESE